MLLENLWRFQQVNMTIHSISSPSAFLKEQQEGTKADSYKLPIMAWSFWGPAPSRSPLEAAQSHLFRTTKTKTKNPITQDMIRVLGALCRDLGGRDQYRFSLTSQFEQRHGSELQLRNHIS